MQKLHSARHKNKIEEKETQCSYHTTGAASEKKPVHRNHKTLQPKGDITLSTKLFFKGIKLLAFSKLLLAPYSGQPLPAGPRPGVPSLHWAEMGLVCFLCSAASPPAHGLDKLLLTSATRNRGHAHYQTHYCLHIMGLIKVSQKSEAG